jgi:hypothetical protein
VEEKGVSGATTPPPLPPARPRARSHRDAMRFAVTGSKCADRKNGSQKKST